MQATELKQIRRMVSVFIFLLLLSGITAFPLVAEVTFMMTHIKVFPSFFHPWIIRVYESVMSTPDVVLYGTDWLAFAHIIISLFFVGVYLDPVRNKFIIDIGIVACFAIFPLAFICGPIRNIPFYHQIIDCSFGALGLIPLYYVKRKIHLLETRMLPQRA
jgi:hypothetical protein